MPYNLAVQPGTGNVFVALGADDLVGPTKVQAYTADGVPLHAWGTVGSLDGQFREAVGIAFGAGSVWASTSPGFQRFSPEGAYQSTLSEPGNSDHAVAVDAAGNVYSTLGGQLTKYDATGAKVTGWGRGVGFTFATAITLAPNGDLYVVDLLSAKVNVLDPSGAFKTAIGGPGKLRTVTGVAVGDDGMAYVADQGTIKVFDMRPPAPPEPTPTPSPTPTPAPTPAPPKPAVPRWARSSWARASRRCRSPSRARQGSRSRAPAPSAARSRARRPGRCG